MAPVKKPAAKKPASAKKRAAPAAPPAPESTAPTAEPVPEMKALPAGEPKGRALPFEIDPKRIEEGLAKLRAEAVHWANKGRYTKVRFKFRGKQLLPDLPLAAVVAAEGLTFYWGGILRALVFNVVGKSVLEVELVNDADKRVQAGQEALLTGDLDEALTLFREALAMDRDNVGAHLNVGVALKLKGDREAALASFERAKALDPEGPSAPRPSGSPPPCVPRTRWPRRAEPGGVLAGTMGVPPVEDEYRVRLEGRAVLLEPARERYYRLVLALAESRWQSGCGRSAPCCARWRPISRSSTRCSAPPCAVPRPNTGRQRLPPSAACTRCTRCASSCPGRGAQAGAQRPGAPRKPDERPGGLAAHPAARGAAPAALEHRAGGVP